jgi:phosphomethylpyrimidine synthase
MVEGPGHIPLDEIETNVVLQKCLSQNAPFYMLGPLVTDIGTPYDHISAAVGASLSSAYGADFICYVTPAEHLGLPFPEDVREGIMAAKLAAHIGDLVKRNDKRQDQKMAQARRTLNWQEQYQLALDGEKAKEIHQSRPGKDEATCTMCGQFCATKIANQYFICQKEKQ